MPGNWLSDLVRVDKLEVLYMEDSKGAVHLKSIMKVDKKPRALLIHQYSISRLGVQRCSTQSKQLALLQSRLPSIPQTTRNYLSSPFIGKDLEYSTSIKERQKEEIKKDTFYYNKNYLPSVFKDNMEQSTIDMIKFNKNKKFLDS